MAGCRRSQQPLLVTSNAKLPNARACQRAGDAGTTGVDFRTGAGEGPVRATGSAARNEAPHRDPAPAPGTRHSGLRRRMETSADGATLCAMGSTARTLHSNRVNSPDVGR